MDIIWFELKRNNEEIDIETPSFHIDTYPRQHEEIYGTVINRIDRDNLPINLSHIYTEMNPNNFSRIIAYLTLVCKIVDFLDEETLREAVTITVQDLKHIDLKKYKVNQSIIFLSKRCYVNRSYDCHVHILPESTCRDMARVS